MSEYITLTPFATVCDIKTLWRDLSEEEENKAEALLTVISNELRYRADMMGKDLDVMIANKPYLADVAKEVVVSVISRILRQNTTTEPMTQESQAGLGYSWSGTYAIAGGGIGNAIMENDLKRLGLKRQQLRTIEWYDRLRFGHCCCDKRNDN